MVDNVTQAGAASSQAATLSKGQAAKSALTSDFETFLKMLTVQVQNQDPLNPIDATDYASQLATFASVEQQVLTNDLLTSMGATLAGNALDGLAGWIGKEGLVAAPAWFEGNPIVVRPEYAAGANSAILSVKDPNGQEIQRVPFSADQDSFVWSGLDSEGKPLPAGAYRFEVESYGADGLIDTSLAHVYSRIEEVRSAPGGPVIRLADGTEMGADQISGLRAPVPAA